MDIHSIAMLSTEELTTKLKVVRERITALELMIRQNPAAAESLQNILRVMVANEKTLDGLVKLAESADAIHATRH